MHSIATFTTCLMLLFIGITARPASASAETDSTPLVIAHRGASGYLPEHTLPAVALAHALGADFIEQDIVLTKDDEPLVIHDLFLDNVTNVADVYPDRRRDDGHYHVADFTLAEIRTLRVHERTDPRSGKLAFPNRYPVGTANFALATLAEHIELIQGLNRTTGRNVGLLVELKEPTWHQARGHDMCRIVVETLARYGYKNREDNAIIQSFDVDGVRRLRQELHTDLRLVQLMNDRTLKLPPDASRDQLTAALGTLAGYVDGVGPSIDLLLTKSRIPGDAQLNELVEVAHAAGLEVFCWTLRTDALPPQFTDFAELVEILTDAGLDGLITDHADKVRESLPAFAK